MATWVGAIVETKGRADLVPLAARHRIVVVGAVTPWLFVQGDARFGNLRPPVFAEQLSRELQGSVIAFIVQTTASVEQLEHFDKGELVRRLEYSGDEGGWLTQLGPAQPWESAYFFDDDEGTSEGANWPLNLGDELTDGDIARYERAKAAKDASGIMDLLSGGEIGAICRLIAHFGVDPEKPGGRYAPPTYWKPRLVALAFVAFLVGMVLLAALTRVKR